MRISFKKVKRPNLVCNSHHVTNKPNKPAAVNGEAVTHFTPSLHQGYNPRHNLLKHIRKTQD